MIKSIDDGKSWSVSEILRSTSQGSDHPLIVNKEDGLFLSWHSDEHGYVFEKFAGRALGLSYVE